MATTPTVPETTTNGVAKKKPGRPRKKPMRVHDPRAGIAAAPHDIAHCIEFIFDEPIIFKKLWTYYKAMAISKLQLIFRRDELIIYGEDHSHKSKVRTRIDARRITHYFCRTPYEIGILFKGTESTMMTIDAEYTKLAIYSEAARMHQNIKTTLSNEMDIDENRTIELIGEYPHIEDESMFLDDAYTIKFELPGKYLKKMLNNIRMFSDQITVRQDARVDPLVFEYKSASKKISSMNIFKSNSKIKLQSTLEDSDTFYMNFKIDYVKPISAALASENITIWMHEDKPIMFTVLHDGGSVEVKILTATVQRAAAALAGA